MSIAIDQPILSTPADEWAKETADALQPAPTSRENTKLVRPDLPTNPSVSSTTGAQFPGAYPRDAVQEMANDSPYKLQETIGQGVNAAKQYIPSQQTVQSYVPGQENIQRAVGSAAETAKAYLPAPVVQAVEKILPAGAATANTTTPPQGSTIKDLDGTTDTSRPVLTPQDSGTSFSSNREITEDSDSSAAPMSNAAGAVAGVGSVMGTAVGGVATTLNPTNDSDSKHVATSKPAEPKISTANIQEPYGENNPPVNETSSRPHPLEGDSGIARTNAALAGLKDAPSDPQPILSSHDRAPSLPPKPQSKAEISQLVGKKTSDDVTHLNAAPSNNEYIESESGLRAPDTRLNTVVGGGNADLSRDSIEGGSDESGGHGHDEHANGGSPKKKIGSRIIQKVKEKLHVGHN